MYPNHTKPADSCYNTSVLRGVKGQKERTDVIVQWASSALWSYGAIACTSGTAEHKSGDFPALQRNDMPKRQTEIDIREKKLHTRPPQTRRIQKEQEPHDKTDQIQAIHNNNINYYYNRCKEQQDLHSTN